MTQEAYCPQHGPYDASLGGCPYCAGSQRPAAPTPLEDDLPTDLGLDPVSPASPGLGGEDGEMATEIPARRAGRGFLDFDGEDETELGRRVDRDDVTELEFDTARGTEGMLWVKEGPRRGRFYPVMHGTVVGRKDGDLILDDPKVSGMHAKFTIENEDFVVWDFGSANGTYVNGKKIREATVLYENDLIKIGDTVFVIKMLEPKPRTRRTSRSRKSSTGGTKAKSSTKSRSAGGSKKRAS